MRAVVLRIGPLWRPRFQTATVIVGGALVAAFAGKEISQSGGTELTKPLLALVALSGAVVLFVIPTEKLFLGWLVVAPLFQNAADASSIGKPLTFVFYLAPAAIIGCQTVRGWRARPDASLVDVFPGLFGGLVLASALVSSPAFRDNPTGLAKEVFQTTLIGVVMYYFLVFGPGAGIRASAIAKALFGGALVQAILSIVEWRTGWLLWGPNPYQYLDFARTSGTFQSPGALGALLGSAIVLALAVLAWSGPARLRRISWVIVVVGVPGLLVTLTRGPILATLVAGFGLLFLARRARAVTVGLLVVVVVALVQLWPQIERAELYQERFADRVNVQGREDVQDVSLLAARKKPVLGWGYGSFEEAKNASSSSFQARVQGSLDTTSHNTFLTILVEFGAIGLAFLLVPLLVIVGRGFATVRRRAEEAWFVAGSMAAVVVCVLTANTTDQKYFSFVTLLPWLFLGAIRRAQSEEAPRSAS